MKLRALNLSSFLLCTAKKEKRLAGLVKYQSEAQLPGPGRVVGFKKQTQQFADHGLSACVQFVRFVDLAKWCQCTMEEFIGCHFSHLLEVDGGGRKPVSSGFFC